MLHVIYVQLKIKMQEKSSLGTMKEVQRHKGVYWGCPKQPLKQFYLAPKSLSPHYRDLQHPPRYWCFLFGAHRPGSRAGLRAGQLVGVLVGVKCESPRSIPSPPHIAPTPKNVAIWLKAF